VKIQAKILAVKGNLIKAEVAQSKFQVGDKVKIVKGSERTLNQNALYWLYLSYVVDNGAQEYGHFDPYGLHLSLKRHFLAAKKMTKGEWKAIEETTTTDMSKSEFSEYWEKVDHFVNETFEIDTSAFWNEYETIFKPDWK